MTQETGSSRDSGKGPLLVPRAVILSSNSGDGLAAGRSRESLTQLALATPWTGLLPGRRHYSTKGLLRVAQVAALYRYPVKSLSPESCDSLTVLSEGRIAGDRVLGFRFADTTEADEEWSRKTGMLALVNTPGLAALK